MRVADSSPYRVDAERVGRSNTHGYGMYWIDEMQRLAVTNADTSLTELPLATWMSEALTNFSFSVWHKVPTAITTDAGLLYRGTHSLGQPLAFWLDNSTTDTFAFIASGTGVKYSAGEVPIGEWFHLCLTFEPEVMRIYVNGVLDGNSPVAISGVDDIGNAQWTLGADSVSAKRNYNPLADPMLWTRTLSESEVKLLTSPDPMYGGFIQPESDPIPYFTRRLTPSRRRTYIPLPVGGA